MSLSSRLARLESRRPQVDVCEILQRVRREQIEDPEGSHVRYMDRVRERLSQPCPPSGLERRIWEGLYRVYGRKLEVAK
jgi:hypothetical protein